MKNYLPFTRFLPFSVALLCLFLVSLKGNSQSLQITKDEIPVEFERPSPSGAASGGAMSYWYNYGEDIYQIAQDEGQDVSYFRTFLFPDSTVLIEFDNGLGAPWKHSQGQVFDPVSPFFSIHSPLVNQFNTYTLDSIGFYYRYFRFQDAAPDTLIVQVYEDNKIDFVADPGWTSGASYASVAYDYTTRVGDNPSHQYTYLLTNDDTISTTQGFLKFPVNIPVQAGKKVAATITYIPGNPFNEGDTIDVYVTPPPVVKRNAFISYEYRDNDMTLDAGYYNNQLTASSDVRYNTNTNGWNGSYIPGTAWNAGFYHLDMEFLITFTPSGIKENTAHSINIFPSPADDNLTLDFSSTENDIVTVSVLDISGREVYSLQTSYVSPAVKHIQLDTKQLTPGIYICKVAGKGFTENLRFIRK